MRDLDVYSFMLGSPFLLASEVLSIEIPCQDVMPERTGSEGLPMRPAKGSYIILFSSRAKVTGPWSKVARDTEPFSRYESAIMAP